MKFARWNLALAALNLFAFLFNDWRLWTGRVGDDAANVKWIVFAAFSNIAAVGFCLYGYKILARRHGAWPYGKEKAQN